jgi:Zn-dependent protease
MRTFALSALLFWLTLTPVIRPEVAAGLTLLVLIHELAHFVCFRHLRMRATAPIFLPYVGGLVVTRARARARRGYAWCVLAGPLAGLAATIVTAMLADALDSRVLQAIAFLSALVNLVNLLPLPGLDGGTIVRTAFRRPVRSALAITWGVLLVTTWIVMQAIIVLDV